MRYCLLITTLVLAAGFSESWSQPVPSADSLAREQPNGVEAGGALPISGLATVFGDDFSQWDIFDYDGERAGELRLRFPPVAGQGGDFTQWTFRMGDIDGTIRRKITGRDDQFEVRVDNEVITVRTLFPRQFDQWSIGSGKGRVVFAVRDYQLLEYWSTRGPGGPGKFEVYTRFEGDPRDWEVYDDATEPISAATQLAMIWLPIYMRLTTP